MRNMVAVWLRCVPPPHGSLTLCTNTGANAQYDWVFKIYKYENLHTSLCIEFTDHKSQRFMASAQKQTLVASICKYHLGYLFFPSGHYEQMHYLLVYVLSLLTISPGDL